MDFWEELDSTVKWVVIGMIALFVATGMYLAYYKAFAVPFQDAQRDAYEHSRSYVEGATRDLGNLCLEVDTASVAHRDLLQDTIRERYVKLDVKDVPAYLQPCLTAARKGANQ
jgi:hypothetical protein